jgi:hypothetical protein
VGPVQVKGSACCCCASDCSPSPVLELLLLCGGPALEGLLVSLQLGSPVAQRGGGGADERG